MQAQERRNAENLSESVGISARAMQRFLTEARWSEDTVIGRLQEYLAPRLGHPEAVWVFDGSDFPKQGRKSAGVARQYCGRLGKVANCQAGHVPSLRQPPFGKLRTGAGGQTAVSAQELDFGPGPLCGCGCTGRERGYRSKTELALELLERALQLGHLRAEWVAGDDAFGMSPFFRDGLAALGMRYVLDVPGSTPVWPLEPKWTSPEYQGFGRPRKPKLGNGQRQTMEQRSDELPDEAWREITVAQGPKGRAPTGSAPSGCGPLRSASLAKSTGLSTAGTWTAVSPGTTCPTLPRTQLWRLWLMWVVPGGVLKRSSRPRTATWGWTSTRPGVGQAGITT